MHFKSKFVRDNKTIFKIYFNSYKIIKITAFNIKLSFLPIKAFTFYPKYFARVNSVKTIYYQCFD